MKIDGAACSGSGGAFRTLNTSALLSALSSGGVFEPSNQNTDNRPSAVVNIPASACSTGDLVTTTLTETGAQASSGILVGGPFAYSATYSNAAGDPATDATITMSVSWPGIGPAAFDPTPSCQPSGDATCPTSWQLGQGSITGHGAVLPAGSNLTIDYTGTGGTDDVRICRPQRAITDTKIVPAFDFADTNYNTGYNAAPAFGNNGRRLISQTSVGSPCEQSHDDAVLREGPFADPDLTTPATQPFHPGQVLYFKTTMSNLDPGPNFTDWSLFMDAQASYGGAFNTSDPNRFWRHQPGDPAGLMYRNGDFSFGDETVPFDTGVRCLSGAELCPTEINNVSSANGGGGMRWIGGWSVWFDEGTRPQFPTGRQVVFASSYKIPDLATRWAGGCVPSTFGNGTTPITFNAVIDAYTNPATKDRNPYPGNDINTFVGNIVYPVCSTSLAVTKTTSTPVMPADRRTSFDIVATNTSANALDLPRLIDYATAQPEAATITCTGTTGGAVCPTFTPQAGTKYKADGSTAPSDFTPFTTLPPALFDFVWGQPGQATMPPSSTVTFHVDMQFAMGYGGGVTNNVLFTGDQASTAGLWPTVGAYAQVDTPVSPDFAITKTVDPVAPRPGQRVTFTVDVANTGGSSQAVRFRDLVDPALAPTNPSGFSIVDCRELTDADHRLSPLNPAGSTPCPVFQSDATGITATVPGFAANSGFRLRYTAVAPLVSTSAPNLATIVANDATASTGDGFASANVLVMTAKVEGTVWHDADGSAAGTFSGIRTNGEPGTDATGLTAVLIDATTHQVIATVAVNADGTYSFDAPVNTDVTVAITATAAAPASGDTVSTTVLPAGWINTSPLQQATFNTGTVTTSNKDFGVEQPPDTDSATAPVRPNPGGSVQVQVPNLSGTDPEDGTYGAAATYKVVALPDPSVGVLYYDGVAVTPGQVIADYDPTLLTVDPAPGAVTVVFTVAAIDAAGQIDPTPGTVTVPFSVADEASISGTVWHDLDRDGVRDAGEPGIEGVTVTLTGTDESGAEVSATFVTGPTGAYSFGNLKPGRYRVVETQPAGYDDGDDVIGHGASNSGTATNDAFSAVILNGGDVATRYDFGEVSRPAPASIAGSVFADINGNGRRDPGEPGIGGVTVTLTGTDIHGDAVSLTTTTDARTGAYQFTGLIPGTYTVDESQPKGYDDGADQLGLGAHQPGTLGNDHLKDVVLGSGDAATLYNFGEIWNEKPVEPPVPTLPPPPTAPATDGPTTTGPTTSVQPSSTTVNTSPRPTSTTTATPTSTTEAAVVHGAAVTSETPHQLALANAASSSPSAMARTGAAVAGLLVVATVLILLGGVALRRGRRLR